MLSSLYLGSHFYSTRPSPIDYAPCISDLSQNIALKYLIKRKKISCLPDIYSM